MSTVTVAVTGIGWLGAGRRSIVSTIEQMLGTAERELLVCAYRPSPGADILLDRLPELLGRGVEVRLVVNHFDEQDRPVRILLTRLGATYRHFEVYDFRDGSLDLHAKVIVVDRSSALVGSANLSRRGIRTNHELAVLVENEAAEDVALAIDRLTASRFVQLRLREGSAAEPLET